MDINKMGPTSDTTSSTKADSWKSKERRNIMVKKMTEYLIKRGPSSWTQNSPELINSVERFEKEVFDSAKDEDEYMARISAKMKAIKTPLQSDESNLSPSKFFCSGAESEANTEWQEQIYQKVQTIKNKNFTKLNILYNGICKKLQQHNEHAPQQPKTSSILKCKQHKQALEYILAIFKVSKSQITLDFEQKLDKAENYIQSIEQSSVVSSHSKVSLWEETPAMNPTSQVMSEQSSHSITPDFHQVLIEFAYSYPQENLVSDKPQGYGNVVQQQTSGEVASPIISTSGILAPPLLENCNDQVKENSRDHTNNSDESSPEMQHLLKVLSSVSAEALVSSCGDIGALVHLNDDMSSLEPLVGPPIGSIGSNLEGVLVTDSQARLLSRGKFVPRERKMNRFINSMSGDSFVQLTSAEKSFSNSNTSQESHAVFEEIKEINKKLIDTEVVVDKENIYPIVAARDTEHGEGFTVKLCFNSVTVNLDPMSKYAPPCKKSIIKPLWLHIPVNYPHCSAVILDEMPSNVRIDSKELDDLSMKVKLKLILSLRRVSGPLSLKDIATSWDRFARETICEYAQLHGGGTFTSKYGGWETCLDDSS